ncbi:MULTISPECIES: hypothetical protein [Paenibacillus]|uniref:hypothetical protein n=1 Tax=Paenibacillus TaxID=44249 RepID=UPI0007ABF6C7|nr:MULTISPECIES: hypothetical protein [Paenibacillus]KZE65048.1 hypothetical protein AV545_03760 [Paenibacillus jamilae]MDN4086032.1 hypothetical protein [Paenibacillus polymyxa]MDN4108353.1 hypothetical protein [Paenibacillus polymyxa]
MKYKKATKSFIQTRYYYEVVISLHVENNDKEENITRDLIITSEEKMTIEDLLQEAANSINDMVDEKRDFYQYNLVEITGLTVVGAYDRNL